MSNNWWGELVDSAKTGLNEFVNEITQVRIFFPKEFVNEKCWKSFCTRVNSFEDDEGYEDEEHYQSQDSEQISTPKVTKYFSLPQQ